MAIVDVAVVVNASPRAVAMSANWRPVTMGVCMCCTAGCAKDTKTNKNGDLVDLSGDAVNSSKQTTVA